MDHGSYDRMKCFAQIVPNNENERDVMNDRLHDAINSCSTNVFSSDNIGVTGKTEGGYKRSHQLSVNYNSSEKINVGCDDLNPQNRDISSVECNVPSVTGSVDSVACGELYNDDPCSADKQSTNCRENNNREMKIKSNSNLSDVMISTSGHTLSYEQKSSVTHSKITDPLFTKDQHNVSSVQDHVGNASNENNHESEVIAAKKAPCAVSEVSCKIDLDNVEDDKLDLRCVEMVDGKSNVVDDKDEGEENEKNSLFAEVNENQEILAQNHLLNSSRDVPLIFAQPAIDPLTGQPKRKRGRPRKYPVGAPLPKVAKKLGRPRKNPDAEPNVYKTKLGRPRKYPDLVKMAAGEFAINDSYRCAPENSFSGADDEILKTALHSSYEDPGLLHVRKKRGRPRKYTIDGFNIESLNKMMRPRLIIKFKGNKWKYTMSNKDDCDLENNHHNARVEESVVTDEGNMTKTLDRAPTDASPSSDDVDQSSPRKSDRPKRNSVLNASYVEIPDDFDLLTSSSSSDSDDDSVDDVQIIDSNIRLEYDARKSDGDLRQIAQDFSHVARESIDNGGSNNDLEVEKKIQEYSGITDHIDTEKFSAVSDANGDEVASVEEDWSNHYENLEDNNDEQILVYSDNEAMEKEKELIFMYNELSDVDDDAYSPVKYHQTKKVKQKYRTKSKLEYDENGQLVKRKRGRPCKNPEDRKPTVQKSLYSGVPRKRGRPRKNPDLSQCDNSRYADGSSNADSIFGNSVDASSLHYKSVDNSCGTDLTDGASKSEHLRFADPVSSGGLNNEMAQGGAIDPLLADAQKDFEKHVTVFNSHIDSILADKDIYESHDDSLEYDIINRPPKQILRGFPPKRGRPRKVSSNEPRNVSFGTQCEEQSHWDKVDFTNGNDVQNSFMAAVCLASKTANNMAADNEHNSISKIQAFDPNLNYDVAIDSVNSLGFDCPPKRGRPRKNTSLSPPKQYNPDGKPKRGRPRKDPSARNISFGAFTDTSATPSMVGYQSNFVLPNDASVSFDTSFTSPANNTANSSLSPAMQRYFSSKPKRGRPRKIPMMSSTPVQSYQSNLIIQNPQNVFTAGSYEVEACDQNDDADDNDDERLIDDVNSVQQTFGMVSGESGNVFSHENNNNRNTSKLTSFSELCNNYCLPECGQPNKPDIYPFHAYEASDAVTNSCDQIFDAGSYERDMIVGNVNAPGFFSDATCNVRNVNIGMSSVEYFDSAVVPAGYHRVVDGKPTRTTPTVKSLIQQYEDNKTKILCGFPGDSGNFVNNQPIALTSKDMNSFHVSDSLKAANNLSSDGASYKVPPQGDAYEMWSEEDVAYLGTYSGDASDEAPSSVFAENKRKRCRPRKCTVLSDYDVDGDFRESEVSYSDIQPSPLDYQTSYVPHGYSSDVEVMDVHYAGRTSIPTQVLHNGAGFQQPIQNMQNFNAYHCNNADLSMVSQHKFYGAHDDPVYIE